MTDIIVPSEQTEGTRFKFKDLGRIESALFHEFGNGHLSFGLQLRLCDLQFLCFKLKLFRFKLSFRIWGRWYHVRTRIQEAYAFYTQCP